MQKKTIQNWIIQFIFSEFLLNIFIMFIILYYPMCKLPSKFDLPWYKNFDLRYCKYSSKIVFLFEWKKSYQSLWNCLVNLIETTLI